MIQYFFQVCNNIFMKDDIITNRFPDWQIERDEADPQFIGWVVLGHRPLALTFANDWELQDVPPEGILGYGNVGHIFTTYAEAAAAIGRTEEFCAAHHYDWVSDMPGGGYRILNVGRIPTPEERLARKAQIDRLLCTSAPS